MERASERALSALINFMEYADDPATERALDELHRSFESLVKAAS